MKPRISPTSPKIKDGTTEELESVYQNDLARITKPAGRSGPRFLTVIFLIVIFSFVTGVLTFLLLFSYGSEIPWLDKIGFLGTTAEPSIFITGRSQAQVLSADVIADMASRLAPTTVQMYRAKKLTSDISSSFIPAEALGSAFVLTDDGYLVTTRSVVGETADITAVLSDGRAYKVTDLIFDPASEFVFLKTDAQDLTSVALAGSSDIAAGSELLLLRQYSPNSIPLIAKGEVIATNYVAIGRSGDFVRSADRYNAGILIGDSISDEFFGSVAFTLDEQAVGMYSHSGDRSTLVPFYEIEFILDGVLAGRSVVRPWLGVRYLDLSEVVNVEKSLSRGFTRGALIYSDDAAKIPSIAADSPAEQGGLQDGDIIVSVDGQELDAQHQLPALLLAHRPDDLLQFSIDRNGVKKEIKITLGTLK